DRPAQGQVAPRPGVRAGQVAGEEPLRRPRAEAAQRDDPGADLVVVELAQRVEVDDAAREAEHILLLPPREAECDEVAVAELRGAVARREPPGRAALLAVRLDETVSDRGRAEERDLLRGDRADEHLPRVGHERRTEAAELGDDVAQDLVAPRPLVEGVEV